ncbi:uncharacterized protein N7484_006864 [Penicillium longicatenatum]|uniref:uncharacterized protein n=1 Tax=Penicillium longicatenatum TaxID=1561947 RepID=UPI00254935AD|nr:uncharacterized protein N7484_006864 [Penicillium longicatenatum]KAJ5639002.1 hypothetical protein N7484_006864 [Penicillium longicatenatum]
MEQTIIVRDVEKPLFNTEVNGSRGDGYQSPTLVVPPCDHEQSLLHNPPDHQLLPRQEQNVSNGGRKFANPVPLGLCAFALTSFISNSTNVFVTDARSTGITIALPLIYGGLVQLISGMWEMAIGNTFGATSFSSYGAYWITFGVMSMIEGTTENGDTCQAETLMGVFMMAWFIFTTLMLLGTLKSSLAMFLLFFFLDMNYLLLGIAHLACHSELRKVGGIFGLLAALAAWWNACAGVLDSSNSFFTVPLGHFPWSPAARVHRAKVKDV